MKKLFTLIALALCAQASMADTTIASYTFPDQKLKDSGSATASGVAGTGCTVDYAKIGGVDSKNVDQHVELNGQFYHKLTNATSAWIKIHLTSGKIQAGDKFSATLYNGKASEDGFIFKETTGNQKSITYSTSEENLLEYTLTDADINDDGSLTIYRISSNCYVRHLEINRPDGQAKEEATASFDNPIIGFKAGDAAGQTVTTNSTGAVTYASSNEAVVTVNESTGALTAVAPGKTTITARVASSDTHTSAMASYTVYVLSGADGSILSPYLPTDFRYLSETYVPEYEDVEGSSVEKSVKAWVSGYIVGAFNSGVQDVKIFYGTSTSSTTTTGTIALANALTETIGANCLSIQLISDSQVRADLNLADHFDNLGKQVWIYGRVGSFTNSSLTVYGLRHADNYSWDGTNIIPAEEGGTTAVKALKAVETDGAAFNIAGQRVNKASKGFYIVDGKKVILK